MGEPVKHEFLATGALDNEINDLMFEHGFCVRVGNQERDIVALAKIQSKNHKD